jgi:DNA gyrase inhibitor GyrI
VAGGRYAVRLARHAADDTAQTVTIQLPAQVLDVAGRPITKKTKG